MKRLSLILSRKSLLTIYKAFVKPNLDCADIISDKPFNEMVQCKAALLIICVIKDHSVIDFKKSLD